MGLKYVDDVIAEKTAEMRTQILVPVVYVTSAASTITLDVNSPTSIVLTGSAVGQNLKLPDTTTLRNGWTYTIWNLSTQPIIIRYSDNSVMMVMDSGVIATLLVYDNTTAVGLWSRPSTTGGGAVAFSTTFNTATTDYFEHNSTSWIVVCSFVFRGLYVFQPKEFQFIGSRPSAGGTALVRIVDYTNGGNIIVSTSFTAAAKALYTTTALANLPLTEAIFEIQVAKLDAGSDKVRIHSANLK